MTRNACEGERFIIILNCEGWHVSHSYTNFCCLHILWGWILLKRHEFTSFLYKKKSSIFIYKHKSKLKFHIITKNLQTRNCFHMKKKNCIKFQDNHNNWGNHQIFITLSTFSLYFFFLCLNVKKLVRIWTTTTNICYKKEIVVRKSCI